MGPEGSGPTAGGPADRPDRLVVVTGTGTEVGKTWVSARVLTSLRGRGVRGAARKPAQSFDTDDTSLRDSQVLAAATGEMSEQVCPQVRNYPVAMAPPMAAEALGLAPPTAAELIAELAGSWDARSGGAAGGPDEAGDPAETPEAGPGLRLVELAGGVRSPMAADADCAEFTARLGPTHVLLVADAGLGTINAVLSSIDSLTAAGTIAVDAPGPQLLVHLNRYEDSVDLHRRNRDWLAGRLGSSAMDPGAAVTVSITELVRRLSPLP